MNAFSYGLDKTMCEFSANVPQSNERKNSYKTRNVAMTLSEVFTTFRVLYLFVRPPSLCRRKHLPKICTLFCLDHIKKRSFLTSCVF